MSGDATAFRDALLREIDSSWRSPTELLQLVFGKQSEHAQRREITRMRKALRELTFEGVVSARRRAGAPRFEAFEYSRPHNVSR